MFAAVRDLPPYELRNVQIVATGLIAGPVVFFAIGVFLRLASPMLAGLVRGKLTDAESAVAAPAAAQTRGALITHLGILEGAAFLCAMALLLTPTWWPLMAAVIPLGTMLAAFPRGE